MKERRSLRSHWLLCAVTAAFCLLVGQMPASARAQTPNTSAAQGLALSQSSSVETAGPTATPAAETSPTAYIPVYRFYNKANGSHFYTASEAEKDVVVATLSSTYTLDGVGYRVDTANPANSQPLYRFYNKVNGSHFYTASEEERERVETSLTAIYSYDGPAYDVSLSPTDAQTVWRFYNKRNGSHFYTTSVAEKNQVVATLSDVYSLDGPAFYLASRGTITIETFGYEFGPPSADCTLVADVRNIDAGYFPPEETGLMPSVRERVMATPEAQAWLAVFRSEWLPVLKPGDKVAIGCARGHHRSVSVAVVFAQDLMAEGYTVDLVHRDILKSW